ncbi:transposase [Cereibacter azotoformans]|uniref:transposase n=1 Tax=Cereibacter azotoformans TaxID=43057 RepID=UPI001F258AA3|nr:transposase [Cereibacter azotoformans]UIJ31731.1 transposase [Cereibacter azotoformans]
MGDRIKHLSWDGQGFCLYYKVLERGRFPWPKAELPADVIDASPAAGREREARRQLHHLA